MADGAEAVPLDGAVEGRSQGVRVGHVDVNDVNAFFGEQRRELAQCLAGQARRELAAAILAHARPESAGNTEPTVAACIGVALGLLDDWLSGTDPHAPSDLARRVRLPAGHWHGERAATDILVLARKGRAFSSLDTLIARQGGEHVLHGSALALTAATQTWAASTNTPVRDLTLTAMR